MAARTKAPLCSYCGGTARLTDGMDSFIPHRDLAAKPVWICDPCDAWVDCRPGSKRPHGIFANAELRRAREMLLGRRINPLWQDAHRLPNYTGRLDPRSIAMIRNTGRKRVYEFLAGTLGIPVEESHPAFFDLDQCREAWTALSGGTDDMIRSWAKCRRA